MKRLLILILLLLFCSCSTQKIPISQQYYPEYRKERSELVYDYMTPERRIQLNNDRQRAIPIFFSVVNIAFGILLYNLN